MVPSSLLLFFFLNSLLFCSSSSGVALLVREMFLFRMKFSYPRVGKTQTKRNTGLKDQPAADHRSLMILAAVCVCI